MAWKRSKTGQIIWYINRTYRVLPTAFLNPWVDDAHRMTRDESLREAASYTLLVELTRPEPSGWMFALASALAIDPHERADR